MSFSHLRRLGHQFSIPITPDDEEMTGRECPNPNCLGYFKIRIGTGLKEENLHCHCPYCGHTEGHDHFWTQEQIKYAHSIVVRKFQEALRQDMRKWDRELRSSTRNSSFKPNIQYKDQAHPIRYYREKQLETKVVCDNCTLEYAIYGVFAYCPDCGTHNSLQILKKNFELAEKELGLAGSTADADFAAYLVADGLENAVSSYDGFGRQVCSVYAAKATDSAKAESLSFQNLSKARSVVLAIFGYDLASNISPTDWEFCAKCFQKRHLLAHTMGIIDQHYIDVTHDTTAVLGRKMTVSPNEVENLIAVLSNMGSGFVAHFTSAVP